MAEEPDPVLMAALAQYIDLVDRAVDEHVTDAVLEERLQALLEGPRAGRDARTRVAPSDTMKARGVRTPGLRGSFVGRARR